MVKLSDISISPADAFDDVSDRFYAGLGNLGWRYYVGNASLAETYINNHAALKSSTLGYVYGSHPGLIIRSDNIEGFLYSNGAVVLSRKDPDKVELWIAEDTATLFGYPPVDAGTN